ncbi:MAG: acyl-CoA dehydrogenase [Deltaproteobacteria bacterium]|nr:acyl-CoA dehydrogenase [Deltaproteobacteria bacterium]
MDFTLTDDQRMLQQMVRDFAQKEIAPVAAQLDERSEFPSDNIRKMAELGLMGMMIPPEMGGSGLDMLTYVLALEELAVACASTAVTMSVNNSLFCGPIKRFGTPAQQQQYLPPFARGEKLGAYCLSEPGTGSDAANQQTTAVQQGDRYLLNGVKNFITNGPHAQAFIVFAMTDKAARHKGITAFIVDRDAPGCKIGKIEKKLGIRASSTSEVVLDQCAVPAANRLGQEGQGFAIAMNTLDYGRIGIAAQALGIGRAAFEFARRYAGERQAFGQAISQFQAIQWKLADMAMKLEAARLLLHQAAWMADQQQPFSKQAAIAKLFASEAANWIAKEAVQVLGGYGYVCEFPVERFYRDAKITEIYEGTSEIQRLVIARAVLRELEAGN